MAGALEKYRKLGLRESLNVPYKFAVACKELAVILRLAFSKFPKPPKSFLSLLIDDTLFAFRLLPQMSMQTESAVPAAYLLLQSAETSFPKQKRTLAATEFKQAKILCKRRGKLQEEEEEDPVNLPQDVLVHVFGFLDMHSLVTAGLVCRSWNVGANDSHLWRLQYTAHFDDSETSLKTKGLPNDEAAQANQRTSLMDVCNVVDQHWKDAFKRAYLGLPYRFNNRAYCFYCESVVWLSNLKCPNQHLARRSENRRLKPLSPEEIGKYVLDEETDSGSESDEEFIPSLRMWRRCPHQQMCLD